MAYCAGMQEVDSWWQVLTVPTGCCTWAIKSRITLIIQSLIYPWLQRLLTEGPPCTKHGAKGPGVATGVKSQKVSSSGICLQWAQRGSEQVDWQNPKLKTLTINNAKISRGKYREACINVMVLQRKTWRYDLSEDLGSCPTNSWLEAEDPRKPVVSLKAWEPMV